MASPGTARQIAFDILMAVAGGGYASDLLLARTALLESRDAGLAETIVMGVLRYRAQLDCLIERASGRTVGRIDAEVATALRMGIFQLRYLDRIPAHAAVGESVELVKRARKKSAAGFANAVLRKAATVEMSWPARDVELSCPEWLLSRWENEFGAAAMRAIATAALQPPERHELDGRVMDIGAQSVVPLLDISEGMTLLDVCAAPGNKTAQAIAAGALAIAGDVHLSRARGLKRLRVPVVVMDGARAVPPFNALFDRVLVDAPCTGTGTLGRNPEIKWKLAPSDLQDLALKQKALVRNALTLLKPGGLLVYSTCSLEREENEDVVAGLNVVNGMRRLPGRDQGDGFYGSVIKS